MGQNYLSTARVAAPRQARALVFAAACAAACATREAPRKPPAPVCTGGVVARDVVFPSKDGLIVGATWSNPCGGAPRPAVVLAHQMCRDRAEWRAPGHDWVAALGRRGVATLAIDLRGHGTSRRWPDGSEHDLCAEAKDLAVSTRWESRAIRPLYAAMVEDLRAAVAWARSEGRSPAVALVGASIGANAALVVAADDPDVAAVVALSPGLDYRGIKTEAPARALGSRPVVLEAAEDDGRGADAVRELARVNPLPRTIVWPAGGHGNAMIDAHPEELETLATFLEAWMRPPQ